MKAFYVLLLVVFLASCGESTIVSTVDDTPVEQASIEQTSQDITAALADLPEERADIIEEITELIESEPEVTKSPEVEPEIVKVPEVAPEILDVQKVEPEVVAVVEEEVAPEIVAASPKVVELSTTYTSPKTEVIMNISYTVTSENTISEISVTSPNYSNMYKFNSGIQNVIGMTIDEAADYHVSGSSLGTVAFQKVLKNM